MLTPHAHTVLWFLAGFLGLWGGSLIVRGLLHRARTGTPTCPACRAAVTVPGLNCPACQFHAKTRRNFWPRTPRWLVAGGGLLTILAAVAIYLAGVTLARQVGERELFTPIATLSTGLFIGVLTIIAWALIGEAPKGRKRCPKCWYEMAPLAAAGLFRCPECGHDAASHNGLLARRRRTKLALALVPLLLVALWVPHIARATQRGPLALMPTWVLIAGMWRFPETWITEAGAATGGWPIVGKETLERRLRDHRESTPWQVSWAAARVRHQLDAKTDPETLRLAVYLAMIDPNAPTPRATLLKIILDTRDSMNPIHTMIRRQSAMSLSSLPDYKHDAEAVRQLLLKHLPLLHEHLVPSDPEAWLWIQMAILLGPDAEPLLPALATIVEDTTAPMRNRNFAAGALVMLTEKLPQAQTTVIGLLQTWNPIIVDYAVRGLWTPKTPEDWAVIRRLVDESTGSVLTDSIKIYSRHQPTQASFAAEVMSWASSPGPKQPSAVAALALMLATGTVQFDDGFPVLAASIRASNRTTKIVTMHALTMLNASNSSSIAPGNTAAIDLLRELASDPDPTVAAAAKVYLPPDTIPK